MLILVQWLCSKGGLRPTARLKKAFKAGNSIGAKPRQQPYVIFEVSLKLENRVVFYIFSSPSPILLKYK